MGDPALGLTIRVGGSVDPEEDVYIVRPADGEVFDLLKQGEYCNLLCSRQMGKTSLLLRTKARLAAGGVKTASVDVGGNLGIRPPENAETGIVGSSRSSPPTWDWLSTSAVGGPLPRWRRPTRS
jgi:hypothetical protein